MTVTELVEEYLKIHQAAPSTIEKLRWLLSKATAVFGDQLIAELRSEEICAWRAARPSRRVKLRSPTRFRIPHSSPVPE